MLQNRSGVLLNKKLIGQALLRSPRGNQHTASEASGVETVVFFNQASFAFFSGQSLHCTLWLDLATLWVLFSFTLPYSFNTPHHCLQCDCSSYVTFHSTELQLLYPVPSTCTATLIQLAHYTGLGGVCIIALTCIIQWHCSTTEPCAKCLTQTVSIVLLGYMILWM